MRLSVKNLEKNNTITIRGDEAWVLEIAKAIHQGGSATPGVISGEITLRTDSAGFIYGKGTLQHTPILSCSRCAKDIPWPLNCQIDVTWRPPFESSTPREMSLSAEDLDVYFIEDGTIDLEELVNDALQCEVPNKIMKFADASENDCGVCGMNLVDELVHGKREDAESRSPFAVLKNLKN